MSNVLHPGFALQSHTTHCSAMHLCAGVKIQLSPAFKNYKRRTVVIEKILVCCSQDFFYFVPFRYGTSNVVLTCLHVVLISTHWWWWWWCVLERFPNVGQALAMTRLTVNDWMPLHKKDFNEPFLTSAKVKNSIKSIMKAWWNMKNTITPEDVVAFNQS